MSEDVQFQVFTEVRGQYVLIKDKKHWKFDFPQDATLEENINVADILKRGLDELSAKQKELSKEVPKTETIAQ